jgi:SPP1 gp7 family putative phage head morphogenesis protein
MKREVVSPNGANIKSPPAPKAEMREFGSAIKYMIDEMATRWRNQVFGYLNKSTIEKFETTDSFADAQTGNFANIFLAQSERVRKKLLKQFDDKRIKAVSDKYTGKISARNKKQFYSRIEKSIGISREELEATEGLTATINAYNLETSQWVKKMRDETLQQWTASTLRQMAEGKGLPEILSQFDGLVEKRKGHAEMVARTQIATFNSLTTKARASNLGIQKARWITSSDERVRPCHNARNGKEFDLSEGLYASCDGKTLLPGVDYNCRCDYELIIPPMADS